MLPFTNHQKVQLCYRLPITRKYSYVTIYQSPDTVMWVIFKLYIFKCRCPIYCIKTKTFSTYMTTMGPLKPILSLLACNQAVSSASQPITGLHDKGQSYFKMAPLLKTYRCSYLCKNNTICVMYIFQPIL